MTTWRARFKNGGSAKFELDDHKPSDPLAVATMIWGYAVRNVQTESVYQAEQEADALRRLNEALLGHEPDDEGEPDCA